MKMTTLKSVAIAVGLCSSAFGQATSPVVGYETLAIEPGLNFVGLRLHEKPVASGQLESATASTVTDDDVLLGDLIVSGTYILELEDGSGIIQEVVTGAGNSLDVAADLTSLSFPVSYTLRPSATLESVFGSEVVGGNLTSGLAVGGASSAGADQIWLWNGSSFDKYYFDEFAESTGFSSAAWVNLANSGAPVDASAVNLVYADGFVISSASGNDFTVAGDLKAAATELNLQSGLNFVSAVAPVGVESIEDAFGSSYSNGFLDSGLAIGGASSAGADQVWVWNGSGFDKYYFDEFAPSTGFASAAWVNLADTNASVDPSAVNLGSGFVISSGGGNATVATPEIYEGL
ncbi:hypothetical protein [Roseibacillus ishigakijimensis]|uniref:PEP-CTERM sorting domain-containing protein n=1 Tax=Roseibacillus ishigakijimensis TaxID=454146 RepID=A0A934RQQ9_9BACT|nr:hypothetical protein [Roseibacillus ishigakijimensis]MBK1833713.1 hypothetical protein [Roseibacillus ishigakijimensis]